MICNNQICISKDTTGDNSGKLEDISPNFSMCRLFPFGETKMRK